MKNKFLELFRFILSELDLPLNQIVIQIPKNPTHGDLTTNYPMINSKAIEKTPMEIAEIIIDKMNQLDNPLIEKITVVPPGFINVKINRTFMSNQLSKIVLSDTSYGRNNTGDNQKALVEFVSANPTGPLTVGHGRNAIIGDCISKILEWNGYSVYREYYFNNAGRQMRMLGKSVYIRYMELLGHEADIPEGGYEGEYIIDIAKDIFDVNGEKYKNSKDDDPIFKETAESMIFKKIEKTLEKINIKFDSFFNENTLYENKEIDSIINELDLKKLIYQKDGATWFKATEVGRDNDRVIIKSSGEPTYRLPDIAYHKDKYKRGYDLMVDIFGSDHMDAYPDVLAAINALGFDKEKTKVLIHQFVTILKNGEPIKMSTRKANFISLDNLIDEVGADVTRFFFIMRNMNSHLNFDLDLAKDESDDNPVFYIQYAHARCCSILRRFENDIDSIGMNTLKLLKEDIEIQIIGKLIEFPEIIAKCVDTLEPQNICTFLSDLSSLLHSYYAKIKVIDLNNKEKTDARIYLVNSIRIVIRNGLSVLGISYPNKM